VAQLLLIFIILLGQQVLGRTADRQSMHTYEDAEAILVDCEQIQNHLMETYLNAEAVLHACERLQAHLRAQDLAIRHVVEHLQRGQGARDEGG
jgi:hypothetical protein